MGSPWGPFGPGLVTWMESSTRSSPEPLLPSAGEVVTCSVELPLAMLRVQSVEPVLAGPVIVAHPAEVANVS